MEEEVASSISMLFSLRNSSMFITEKSGSSSSLRWTGKLKKTITTNWKIEFFRQRYKKIFLTNMQLTRSINKTSYGFFMPGVSICLNIGSIESLNLEFQKVGLHSQEIPDSFKSLVFILSFNNKTRKKH